MSKRTGLISHQSDDGGLLYVFIPGKPDLIINQQQMNNLAAGDHRPFVIGDFITFIDINGSINSPTRIKPLFETRIHNNRLQARAAVAFSPQRFNDRAEFTAAMLAWSPDFAYVGCFHTLTPKPRRNHMYMAWIERVPQMNQIVGNISISWHIVGEVSDDCNEETKQLLADAPWNNEQNGHRPSEAALSRRPYRPQHRRPPVHQRPSAALLKTYIDNYEGLVTSKHESSVRVWSLAIPITEVLFLFGAREGMKVGDWVQFNCEPLVRPHLECYLLGKKFSIIEPVLPSKSFNNTVMVEIITNVSNDTVKYFRSGEVTVNTEILGPIEFKPGRFRQGFCDKRLRLAVYKDVKSSRTGAVWRFFAMANQQFPPTDRMRVEQREQPSSVEYPLQIEGEVKNLQGVITNRHEHRIFIWAKEVGEVLWEAEVPIEKFYPGVWVIFGAVPLVPSFHACTYTVRGQPRVIPAVLETRVLKGLCQIKTKIECYRSAHSDVQSAYSEKLGRIFIPDSIPKFGPHAYLGYGDFLGSFVVWVRRKFGGLYHWEIAEIIERCVESRHSRSCADLVGANVDNGTGNFSAQTKTNASTVDYLSNEHRLQRLNLHDSSSAAHQKEVNNDVYSDFFDDNTFGNRNTRIMKEEKKCDPLSEPAFGGKPPRSHAAECKNALNKSGFGYQQKMEPPPLVEKLHNPRARNLQYPGYPETSSDEQNVAIPHDDESLGDEQEELLDNRAELYWIRVWQIPAVRRQIAQDDEILYANIMQLMTDLDARVDGDSLEEALKPPLRLSGERQ